MKNLIILAGCAICAAGLATPVKGKIMDSSVISWPAPAGEPASTDYSAEVNGTPVFVYPSRVRAEILQNDGLWTHKRDCGGERAAFAIFDIAGEVTVDIRPGRKFTSATVLPDRAGIKPEIRDGHVRFKLAKPQHLTLLLDDSDLTPLHLFIGEPEKNVPKAGDPDVVYFGPGVHEINTLQIKSGQTVYLAGGAIVKGVIKPGDEGTYSEKWKVTFFNGVVFAVDKVENVRICGRGILDGSLIPHPGRNLIWINGSKNIRLEGIVLKDSPNWNVLIGTSSKVRVDDLRIVSGRLNSDGINSVNSGDVKISRCFVRNHDDSIVVKTTQPGAPAEDISVEDCQFWSDWGYSMGVTYETRAPVRKVSYRNCDVLYARHWCMGIHVSDSASISDVSFTGIEIADFANSSKPGNAQKALSAAPKLLRMVIVQDCWGNDPDRGQIRNVTLDGITVHGSSFLASEMFGLDKDHNIQNVTFRNIRLAGQSPVTDAKGMCLEQNAFVSDVRISAE